MADAFEDTITDGGYHIDPDALAYATQATGGYPFMIQLVGYQVWRRAANGQIDLGTARAGVEAARIRLGALVHATALKGLSDVDRTFLVAMSHDDGPSTMADIGRRMGKPGDYTTNYRKRLIDAGMIASTGWGRVDFAMPYLREYLREHAASLEMAGRTQSRQATSKPDSGQPARGARTRPKKPLPAAPTGTEPGSPADPA